MSRKCKWCKKGELKILGTGNLNDTIIVECDTCCEIYEVEPDGLDEGGIEFAEAQLIEIERRN